MVGSILSYICMLIFREADKNTLTSRIFQSWSAHFCHPLSASLHNPIITILLVRRKVNTFWRTKKLPSSCLLVYTRKDSKYSSKIGTLTRVILLILYTARASCASFIKLCLLIEYRSAPSSYLINSFFFIFASILHLFPKDCSFSLAMVLAYLPIKTQPIIRICFYWKILKNTYG